MRKLFLYLLLLVGCASYSWSPPRGDLWVRVTPGNGHFVRANKKTQEGRWYRTMTVIVMLRGAPPEMCTVILNEDPNFVFQFAPLEGTWTVTFPAALGEHSVRVNVGTRQKVVKFLVWREGENVPPEAGRIE